MIEKIVRKGTLRCNSGQHRELAFTYLEMNEHKLPTDEPVLLEYEVEIILNVIIDGINQVGRMWNKVLVMGGFRKRPCQSDAYRLNCTEFGDEDMGTTGWTILEFVH